MRRLRILLIAVMLVLLWPVSAKAVSGTIAFSTDTPQPVKGGVFTVVCQVTSTENFVDAEFDINYDSKILTFVEGGSKVTGGQGILHVSSVDNDTAVNKRTFSLQFKAKKVGTTLIELSDSAKITDANSASVSVSSNQLSVQVVETAADTTTVTPTPSSQLSNSNRLEILSVDAVSMTPEFAPKVSDYQIIVDASTSTLFYHAQTKSKKARIRVEGNTDLKEGANAVTVFVTSESGKVRKYNLAVTKETAVQTSERVSKEQVKSGDIVFHANQADGTITLQNEYSFIVLKMVNDSQIPAGYAATKMTLDGVSVPVYALEDDMENDFVLLYLQGPTGEQGIYQYDRKEKTIQRYASGMLEPNNKNGTRRTTESSSSSSIVYFVIIGVLSLMVLGLLITVIKLLTQKKSSF